VNYGGGAGRDECVTALAREWNLGPNVDAPVTPAAVSIPGNGQTSKASDSDASADRATSLYRIKLQRASPVSRAGSSAVERNPCSTAMADSRRAAPTSFLSTSRVASRAA